MVQNYFKDVVEVWSAGGWIMVALAVLSLWTYGLACRLLVFFAKRPVRGGRREAETADWVTHPEKAPAEVREIIEYADQRAASEEEVRSRFSEVFAAQIPELDRRLSFMNIMVAAAPLLGLLGTVLGMLTTFSGIAAGGGAETVDLISAGISKALITTEMGLLVAIPGYLFSYVIKGKRNQYEAFLVSVESRLLQRFQRPGFSEDAKDRQPEEGGQERFTDSESNLEPAIA